MEGLAFALRYWEVISKALECPACWECLCLGFWPLDSLTLRFVMEVLGHTL